MVPVSHKLCRNTISFNLTQSSSAQLPIPQFFIVFHYYLHIHWTQPLAHYWIDHLFACGLSLKTQIDPRQLSLSFSFDLTQSSSAQLPIPQFFIVFHHYLHINWSQPLAHYWIDHLLSRGLLAKTHIDPRQLSLSFSRPRPILIFLSHYSFLLVQAYRVRHCPWESSLKRVGRFSLSQTAHNPSPHYFVFSLKEIIDPVIYLIIP